MTRFQMALIASALGITSAQAQDIDCANAQVQLEMTFCAERDWKVADADLNKAYAAAQTMMVRVTRFDAGDDATLDKAFAAIVASGAQGLIVPSDPVFAVRRAKLVRGQPIVVRLGHRPARYYLYNQSQMIAYAVVTD